MGQSRPPQQQFKINQSNPFATGAGGAGLGHDDIFGAGDNNTPNPGFGGPAKPPGAVNTGDPQMDDFINQLNDLKNL